MCDHRPSGPSDSPTVRPGSSPEHTRPDGTASVPTTGATGQERSDRAVDPGDSHDKGALSLCVGEAA
jgi:hypothetical protein